MSAKTSNNGFVFPLWIKSDSPELELKANSPSNNKRRFNFSIPFLDSIATKLELQTDETTHLPRGLTGEVIFQYIYAVLFSPSYRSRYSEFLKGDFPRIPLTQHQELFHSLSELGHELIKLHLLESANLSLEICIFTGDNVGKVEKSSWSKNTVWIDIAQSTGFTGVSEEVWNFHVGGYQVCEKWLKDRKGRKLSREDVLQYRKIIASLSKTIVLMADIDKVIQQYGSWPDAF